MRSAGDNDHSALHKSLNAHTRSPVNRRGCPPTPGRARATRSDGPPKGRPSWGPGVSRGT
eukprot:4503794-Alexandrium_andersonii.AAC.1